MNDKFVMEVLELFSDDNSSLMWSVENGVVSFAVNCSDVFAWGCADAEDITPENISILRKAMEDCELANKATRNFWSGELFACRVRGMRPQGAAYPKNHPELWPLLDACGPVRKIGFGNPKPSPSEVPA